jgi:beta-galactosidase GanA
MPVNFCHNKFISFDLLAIIILLSFTQSIHLFAQKKELYVGVSYYPLVAGEKIDFDIKKMKEVGINQVRFGEFDWISMEPKEGSYDFNWIEKTVKKFSDAGIAVQLCTPTAAPPIWLEVKHPEILRVNALGLAVGHGGRRQYCPNSIVYRKYCRLIVEKLAQKFGNNPGVIAWQIDNELWEDCYCDECLAAFHKWLANHFGTIENLNNEWLTELWSQKYQSFDQVSLPNPNAVGAGHHPSLWRAYRNFMSDSYVSFCNEQVKVLRKYTKAPITTNAHNPVFQNIDYKNLFGNLDFVCTDSYAGPGQLYRYAFEADWMRSLGKPFWLAETASSLSAGTAVPDVTVFAHDKGAVRAKMWMTYALGGEAISFWLWRAHWAGQELEHGSLLYSWGDECINTPEITKVASELNKYKDWLLSTKPGQAKAALYYGVPTQWIFESTPIAAGFQYDQAISSFYKLLFDAGISRDVIMADADIKNYDVVFSPYMPSVTKSQFQKIKSFVENGGTWVLGPLSACRTEEATAYPDACYGKQLEEWLGVHVRHRLPPMNVTSIVSNTDTSKCELWCDAFQLENQNVKALANYSGGALDSLPAIVECKIGKGRVLVLGTKPGNDWLTKFIEKNVNAKTCNADPGILVAERVNEKNESAGAIIINTNDKPHNLNYNGISVTIDGYGVEILPSGRTSQTAK